MRIAILYVCTGKYVIFWEDFYKSSEKNFIPGAEKKYFIFTDALRIAFDDRPNVEKIHQDNLGWPKNTLMRYKMFEGISDKLIEYDYIFFFNANTLFVKPIKPEDFLPQQKETLVAVIHSGYADVPVSRKPFESRTKSRAFMTPKANQPYFQGAVNGGVARDFIEAIKELNADIEADLKDGIIAAWWDESHWNRYLAKRPDQVKILPPAYLCPEGVKVDYEPIIVLREKSRHGGHLFLRNERPATIRKFFTSSTYLVIAGVKNIPRIRRVIHTRKLWKLLRGLSKSQARPKEQENKNNDRAYLNSDEEGRQCIRTKELIDDAVRAGYIFDVPRQSNAISLTPKGQKFTSYFGLFKAWAINLL
jgi:hypothetical protein